MSKARPFIYRLRGATALSYALLVGLISVVALSAIDQTGDSARNLMSRAATALEDGNLSLPAASVSASPSASASASPSPSASASPVGAAASSFSQANGSSSFTVTWSGGFGHTSCVLQHDSASGFQTIGSINCNAGSGTFSISTPGASWNGRTIRIAADSGATPLNTLGTLTCSPQTGATSPTPTIDEDCNGVFDNTTSANTWVATGSSGSVSNNGCSYGNYGTIGGTCSGCTGSAAFCIRNSDNTISRVCAGSGFGSRSYPSQAVCQSVTRYN